MEIIESIDNAVLHNDGARKPLYHLIFTNDLLVAERVMNRSDELRKNPIRGRDF